MSLIKLAARGDYFKKTNVVAVAKKFGFNKAMNASKQYGSIMHEKIINNQKGIKEDLSKALDIIKQRNKI